MKKIKVILGEENIMDIYEHNLNKSLLSWKMKGQQPRDTDKTNIYCAHNLCQELSGMLHQS